MIMLFIFCLFNIVSSNKVINPSCNSCKWFLPNIKGSVSGLNYNDYGLCKMFKNDFDCNGNKVTIYDFAMHCRHNEDQCGENGVFYENYTTSDIDYKNEIQKLINEYNDVSNSFSGEVNEKNDIEDIEKDLFFILQKLKKFNKKQIELFGKSFYDFYKSLF
jgi:hypothetical protein